MLSDPCNAHPLRLIDGKLLHPELVNWYFTATENYEKYKYLAPVFVTRDDESVFNDIKNWTNKKIHTEVSDRAEMFPHIYESDIKRQKASKEKLITFYETAKTEMESQFLLQETQADIEGD